MFTRKKDGQAAHGAATPAPAQEIQADSRQKKGPTPSRKQAQRKNYRPVVSDRARMTKAERKERDKQLKAKRDEAWQAEQTAMRTGDERNMPAVHKGPERRLGRDYIDARINLSAGFMPLAFFLIIILFLQGRWPVLFMWLTLGCYVIFALMLIDSVIASQNAKVLIEHKFGADRVPARIAIQMFSRTFYIRRWRMPSPQVKIHEWAEGASPADVRTAWKNHRENRRILRGKA